MQEAESMMHLAEIDNQCVLMYGIVYPLNIHVLLIFGEFGYI